MKKYSLLFLLITIAKFSFGQQVIINGSSKNRLLTWDDFSGKPDKQSEHAANTAWKVNYSYTGLVFNGDSAKLKGLSITLGFDTEHSWIKEGKATANLLKHEQGHFDIGLLCLKEMVEQLNNVSFAKLNAGQKAQDLFNKILAKYTQINRQYDDETDHSKKKEGQEKWDRYFAVQLNR